MEAVRAWRRHAKPSERFSSAAVGVAGSDGILVGTGVYKAYIRVPAVPPARKQLIRQLGC